jgi:DNA-binding NarL/FixJ family response regulator
MDLHPMSANGPADWEPSGADFSSSGSDRSVRPTLAGPNLKGGAADSIARPPIGSSSARPLMTVPKTQTRPVSVAIVARDQLTEDALILGLRSVRSLLVLTGSRVDDADVVLILANELDEVVMKEMAELAKESAGSMRPIVLVCHRIGEHQVLEAVDYGLVSVISWSETNIEALVQVILSSYGGQSEMPSEVLGAIMRRMRTMRMANSPSTQVSTREVDVIRLLADGLGTLEIARNLNFSERTIKNIVASLSSRFELQNRAHLVAFAFRNGIV